MRRYLILFVAALSLPLDISAARILGLFPHTGRSHQMVFEPLLYKLAERRHQVTVVSFFPLKTPPANYTDVSLEELASVRLESMDLARFERTNIFTRVTGIEKIARQILGFHALADLALNVCQKVIRWMPLVEVLRENYDLIIMEHFNSDCMVGLLEIYKIKTPVVALQSTVMMPWLAHRMGVSNNPAYVPGPSTQFAERMTYGQRIENTFVNLCLKVWYRYSIQLKEQEILETYFRRKIPDLYEIGKRTSLTLINSFHSLHGNFPSVSGLVEVGGIHLETKRKTIPNYMERFLNESEHGVILFSLGSLVRTSTMPKYKQDIIVNVLSKLKQRVLWKFEDSDEEGTLTGNILRAKWIPQYELLRHNKVVAFIAHGGMLGMTEAISAGKPMVVMPFYGDQPLNAASAAKVGLGTVISYMDLTEESFTEALQKVLSTEMRESARRISNIWKDRQNSPMDTAIYNIERVIRWGHLDPLHSPARDLAFYEYVLLDVIAAYVAAIVVVVLVLRSVLILIFRVSKNLSSKNKLKQH